MVGKYVQGSQRSPDVQQLAGRPSPGGFHLLADSFVESALEPSGVISYKVLGLFATNIKRNAHSGLAIRPNPKVHVLYALPRDNNLKVANVHDLRLFLFHAHTFLAMLYNWQQAV